MLFPTFSENPNNSKGHPELARENRAEKFDPDSGLESDVDCNQQWLFSKSILS